MSPQNFSRSSARTASPGKLKAPKRINFRLLLGRADLKTAAPHGATYEQLRNKSRKFGTAD